MLFFPSWQHQKRSTSARLPHFWSWQHQKQSNSARPPHFLKLTTSKTKQVCETSFRNGNLSAELTASYRCVLCFAIFPVHLSKVLRLPRKSDAKSNEVLHLSRKIISANLKIWCSKMQPPFRKSAPWPPNISDEHVFCTAPATQKHIWTSKSAPCPSVFCTFDFEMCFAPQRSALFRHRNFYKWFEAGVFCTFWLRNVLRAETACNFSSIIWPDGSAPAALASLLFDPPELQIIGTTQCFATFLPFRASVLYSTLLFSLTLPISAFHLSILSEVWLLNFLRQWHNLEKGYR